MRWEKKLRILGVNADGEVPGLKVVGIHGFLSDRRTPAIREPVYQTDDGRLARIEGWGSVFKDSKTPRYEVSVKVADTILGDDEELPGNGTRVGPWRVRCAPFKGNGIWVVFAPYKLVAVGSYERVCAVELACRASRPKVQNFFQQLVPGFGRVLKQESLLVTTRRSGTVWYTSWEDVEDLFCVIRDYALNKVTSTVKPMLDQDKEKARERLEKMSWWLSRASFDNDHQYFAVAGLKRAGVDGWSQVLKDGLPTRTDQEREDGLRKAEEILNYLSKVTR